MKRFLIVVAFLSVPGCSTPGPLASLPLFSRGDMTSDDIGSSRSGAMTGKDGPGSVVKLPFNW